ncbi:hypothetical protein KC330_g9068 [Hortaea werneckii]|nr:hypothetical protein KC330_g9068 [Hortaea werneckii]
MDRTSPDSKRGYVEQAQTSVEKEQETSDVRAEHGCMVTVRHGSSRLRSEPEGEARLRRKLDLYIIPTVFLLYLFCFIDRANIGNARLVGLEDDLNLQGHDYNTLLSCFYVSYVVFEIPATMACKVIGPGWFIPGISLAFGICSVGTAFVQSFSAALL